MFAFVQLAYSTKSETVIKKACLGVLEFVFFIIIIIVNFFKEHSS